MQVQPNPTHSDTKVLIHFKARFSKCAVLKSTLVLIVLVTIFVLHLIVPAYRAIVSHAIHSHSATSIEQKLAADPPWSIGTVPPLS